MIQRVTRALAQKQKAVDETQEALAEARREFNRVRAEVQEACLECDESKAKAAWEKFGKASARVQRLTKQVRRHQGDLARLRSAVAHSGGLAIA